MAIVVVAAVLLLIGVALFRQQAGGGGSARRPTPPADLWSPPSEPDPLPIEEPALMPASRPPREVNAGAEVLEHLRQLEARATPGLMSHVIPIFIHDTEARLQALKDAVAREDGETAHRVAHTLHGSAATVGAASMVHGCAEVIRQVRVGAFDRCEAIISDLATDLESIRQAAQAKDLPGNSHE
jgi:HPt (histidine-containing phosphotransfer) domain-containing protein